MSDKNDSNYVSVGSWMLMMLVTAIPCIGVIMIVVWAFTGENESRKNYYRAILAWFGILLVLFAVLAAMGQGAQWLKAITDSIQKR
jgi:threonine/homoserine/homoserine lactone efflux protein